MATVDRIIGWFEGFMAAAQLVPSQSQPGWPPEVWAAAISTAGAVVMGLVGVGGAILGTKIGARANQAATLAAAGQLAEVNRKRYIGERVWDERRRAYSLILTNLSRAGDFWSYLDDGFSEAGSNAEGFFQSDAYRNWRKEAFEQWWEAKKAFSENRIILSERFVEKFSALREDVAANEYDYDPPGEPRIMKDAFRSAFADMLEVSKCEISP